MDRDNWERYVNGDMRAWVQHIKDYYNIPDWWIAGMLENGADPARLGVMWIAQVSITEFMAINALLRDAASGQNGNSPESVS